MRKRHPLHLVTLSLVLLSRLASPSSIWADEPAVVPIPWPGDANMEAAIQEQLRAVRATLEPMIAETPTDQEELAEAYGNAGQVYLVYSLVDSSQACFFNAATLAPEEFRWNYYLGRTYQEDGKPKEAAFFLGRAHALRPADIPALIRLAQTELINGRLEEADAHFHQVLVLDPGNANAHFGLGQVAHTKQDFQQAIEQFEAALASQPEATAIHYQLALAYRDLGDADQGRRHLTLRGQQEVQFDDPLMQELRTLVRGGSLLVYSATHARAAGDLDAAAQGFRQALEIDPANNSARLNLASTLIQQGDLSSAGSLLEEALRYDETNSSAHYNLGLVLEQTGQRDLALEHMRQATDLAPDYVDAHLNYGLLLQEVGRLDEAEQQYSLAAQLDPTDATIRFRHASVLLQLSRLQEAVVELQLALDVQSDSVDGYLLLARAQGVSGQYADSADSFARVLALDPENSEARFARALALLLAEEYQKARDHLEQSLQRQPSNLALKNSFARLLATCPEEDIRDGARALRLAQEVVRVELAIDHAETVAMALAETGQFDEAASLQLKIIDQATRVGGDTALRERLQRNLELYRNRQPVRAPWKQSR